LQLITEFKRLGSSIVSASFNRIIISTKKKSLVDAKAYLDYVVEHIVSKEIFQSIILTTTKMWNSLLWMDSCNYAAICTDELEHQDNLNATSEQQNIEEQLTHQVDFFFDVAKYLPLQAGVQQSFKNVIAGYISTIYTEMQRRKKEYGDELNEKVRPRLSVTQQQEIEDQEQDSQMELTDIKSYAQDIISGQLSVEMFKVIQKMNKRLPSDRKSLKNTFPFLPGSHMQFENPVLELIKTVCHVLQVDSDIYTQVEQMKRNLLRFVSVGEFSPLVEWKEPSASFVVRQLLCTICNKCNDVDICRDAVLSEDMVSCFWNCPSCGNNYDMDLFEERLIDELQSKMISYNLQDLICKKCKNIKQNNLNKNCSCAGNFDLTLKEAEFMKMLNIFSNVSKFASFDFLHETVTWINESIRL